MLPCCPAAALLLPCCPAAALLLPCCADPGPGPGPDAAGPRRSRGPPPTHPAAPTAPPSPRRRDEHYGFQLYQSDPSGNYGGWKAVAIGAGHQAAQNLLKSEYKDEITMAEVGVPLKES